MEAADLRPADAVVDVQLCIDLPGVLREALKHESAPDGVGARSNFGVAVGQTERQVCQSNAGGGA